MTNFAKLNGNGHIQNDKTADYHNSIGQLGLDDNAQVKAWVQAWYLRGPQMLILSG